jgi:hypothetical protein
LTTRTPSRGKCITCKKIITYENSDAGHFLTKKSHHSVKFNEKNCHLQCSACNTFNCGEQLLYIIELEKMYGRKVVDNLILEGNRPRKFTDEDYIKIIEVYNDKISKLLKGHNVQMDE